MNPCLLRGISNITKHLQPRKDLGFTSGQRGTVREPEVGKAEVGELSHLALFCLQPLIVSALFVHYPALL